jgi:hypothetical protein
MTNGPLLLLSLAAVVLPLLLAWLLLAWCMKPRHASGRHRQALKK